jgi:hypothetical protein
MWRLDLHYFRGQPGDVGGLVEVTHRFSRVIKSALERARLCSGDPDAPTAIH